MDALEVIRERRSMRDFRPDAVERSVIEAIVDCGRLAPTARNDQPWEFVVVVDQGMREKIAAKTDYGRFISKAPVCVVVFCQDTKYYLEDGSAATENILLAATAQGLGSCWVAGDKKQYAEDIREMLGVPKGHKLVSMIPIGHPVARGGRASKRPLEEVLHWEKW
jgi:nitroreductase